MTSVFLSHSSLDKAVASRLALDLKMSRVKDWLDEWEIRVGDSIPLGISRGLDESELVVVLLSEHSVDSGWVEKEWSSKVGEEAASREALILPVLLEDCTIPALLRDKRYADMRENYMVGLADLLTSVRSRTHGQSITAGARIKSGRIVFGETAPHIPALHGLMNSIELGCFERHEDRLRVHLHVVASHQKTQQLTERMGMNRLILVSEDLAVSVDKTRPTVFTGTETFRIPAGERIFDLTSRRTVELPFEFRGSTATTVSGYAKDGAVTGSFTQVITYEPPSPVPTLQVRGSFSATIE